MMALECGRTSDALVAQALDFRSGIAALRRLGADRFDPVGLHYLERLASHSITQQDRVQCILGTKLAAALASFRQRFERAQLATQAAIADAGLEDPLAAIALERLFAAGDFSGVLRLIAQGKRSGPRESLADLARYVSEHAPQSVQGGVGENVGSRPELKALRYFRSTWSKLSVDRQVAQALGQAPRNAGPINSHKLVLRSLALMRELSPDYLQRFMSYADTLLCLEQGEQEKQTPARKSADGDGATPAKRRRSRVR